MLIYGLLKVYWWCNEVVLWGICGIGILIGDINFIIIVLLYYSIMKVFWVWIDCYGESDCK